MISIPMTPQASHLRRPSSDSGRASSPQIPSFAPQATSSQHTSAAQNMLSTIPTTAPASHEAGITKRPKLSLQTASLPITYGKSTTGLSLSFAPNSTNSPTVLNTFNNAYDVARPSASVGGVSSPSKQAGKIGKITSPYAINKHKETVPYQLPLGVRSILRNSPIPASSRRQNSLSMTTKNVNGVCASRRLLFPASKQVSYRFPLEEEIKTVRFRARHSDIPSESDSEVSDESRLDDDSDSNTSHSDLSSSEEETGTRGSISPLTQSKRKKRRSSSSARQIRAVSLPEGQEENGRSVASPQTPRQECPKRRREWRWTLGSFETSGAAANIDITTDDTDSNDSFTTALSVVSEEANGPSDTVADDTKTEDSGMPNRARSLPPTESLQSSVGFSSSSPARQGQFINKHSPDPPVTTSP